MTVRKTTRELTRILRAARVATPGLVPTFKLLSVGTDKTLKFHAEITIDGTPYLAAGDSGKVKVFATADDALKYIAKATEVGSGNYALAVETGILLSSAVPSDLKKWAAAQITKLGQTKISQQAVVADIDVQLGLMVGWENGNPIQQAKKQEALDQKAAVNTDIAAIDTEVLRLTDIVNS